jgi:hypothetical protein
MPLKIDVLGTKYTVVKVKSGADPYMEEMHFSGYCDSIEKRIVLLDLKTVPEWQKESDFRITETQKETMRHELIHAFLNESGLEYSSHSTDAWAKNEEMVDWFAIQMPKLLKAFKAADCL